MNPNYTEFKFPAIRAHPWSKVFSKRLPPDAVDLVRFEASGHNACRSVSLPLRSRLCALDTLRLSQTLQPHTLEAADLLQNCAVVPSDRSCYFHQTTVLLHV